MACLDENTVVEFVEGRISDSARTAVEAHIDDCPSCRLLLSELARTSSAAASAPAPAPPPPSLVRDDTGVLQLSDTSSVELIVGKVLNGRYRVVRMLGRGAVGTVYHVEDLELRESVALKLLRPEVASLPRVLDHLRHEVVLGRRITHPNVCRLHDIGSVQGRYFITMSLVQGESLATYLERGAPPPQAAHAYLLQICDALEAAHQQGVVHRDLKTSNIMVDPAGRITVMDFGLARDLWGEPSQSGMLVGSPAYWSPEQACGERATERSDIYSFGVVACELFGARRPRFGQRLQAARIPRPYRPVLMRCVQTRPEDRFQSVAELRRALRAAARAAPDRPRWLWPVVAVVGLGLGACAAYAAVLLLRSRPPAPVKLAATRQPAARTPEAKPAPEVRPALEVRPAPVARPAPDVLPTPEVKPTPQPRRVLRIARRGARPDPPPAPRPKVEPKPEPEPQPVPQPVVKPAQNLTPFFAELKALEQQRKRREILLADLPAYKTAHQQASRALDRAEAPAALAALARMKQTLGQTRVDRAFISAKLARLTRQQSPRKSSPQVQKLFARVHAAYFSGDYKAANRHLNAIFRLLR